MSGARLLGQTLTWKGAPLVGKREDIRRLLQSIVAHEGHGDIVVCYEQMIATARAALVVLDREDTPDERAHEVIGQLLYEGDNR